jgi:enolase-phosphatase E1
MIDVQKIRSILLDVEGTTTSISFVYDVLFPYAARNLESYVRQHSRDNAFRAIVADLYNEREADKARAIDVPEWSNDTERDEIASIVAYCRWLMSKDSKTSALKSLQGKIWQQGYVSGELKGQVFDDVPGALRRWREQGKRVYIYSSGSVLAQKLIFSHSNYGDLTPLIDGYFDTGVGTKHEASSYSRIVAEIHLQPEQVLFVSDALKELQAARAAGLETVCAIRPGNLQVEEIGYESIHNFDELPF